MFAPLGKRWPLTIIWWWGGWAVGEHVSRTTFKDLVARHSLLALLVTQNDTLIKYLLDELASYENDHRDALCPISRQANTSFNGDHILTPQISAAEMRELICAINRKLEDQNSQTEAQLQAALAFVTHSLRVALHTSPTSTPPPLAFPNTNQALLAASSMPSSASNSESVFGPSEPLAPSQSPNEVITITSPSTSPWITMATDVEQTSSPRVVPPCSTATTSHGSYHVEPQVRSSSGQASNAQLSDTSPSISNIERGPDAWKMAIRQWESVDERTGYALRDWPVAWYTGTNKAKFAAKRGQRQLIADEYER